MKWPGLNLPPINQSVLIDALSFKELQEAQEVESPCIRVCVMQGDRCKGCNRTMEEIANWSELTNQERKEIRERKDGC